jgi:hypothetical protein
MKSIHFFLTIVFLLTACAPATAVLSTATIEPSATSIPTSTISIASETPAPTATEAAQKVANTKVENGYTYTYTVVRTADGKQEYQGWFRPMTPMSIPMIEEQGSYLLDGKAAKNVAPITILVEEGVPGADAVQAFTHASVAGMNNNRYIGFIITEFGNNNNDVWQQARNDFQAGTRKYSVQFGNTLYDWYPSPDHGSIVYILNPNDPAISKDNGFVTWTDAPYGNKFSTIFWELDMQGNTQGGIASLTPLNQLNKNELDIFPFYHVASIIGGSGDDLKLYSGGYSQLLQQMMQNSEKSNPPYIEISTQTLSATPTLTPTP